MIIHASFRGTLPNLARSSIVSSGQHISLDQQKLRSAIANPKDQNIAQIAQSIHISSQETQPSHTSNSLAQCALTSFPSAKLSLAVLTTIAACVCLTFEI